MQPVLLRNSRKPIQLVYLYLMGYIMAGYTHTTTYITPVFPKGVSGVGVRRGSYGIPKVKYKFFDFSSTL